MKEHSYKVLNRTCDCCCGFPPFRQNKLLKHRAKVYFASQLSEFQSTVSQLFPSLQASAVRQNFMAPRVYGERRFLPHASHEAERYRKCQGQNKQSQGLTSRIQFLYLGPLTGMISNATSSRSFPHWASSCVHTTPVLLKHWNITLHWAASREPVQL